MATEQVVAHAMYQKYANAVPLYRQETDWAQYGLPLSRGRLARWIQFCSEDYFLPVYAYLHRLLLQRKFLMADETRIQVLKEPQRAAERDSFLWVFRSGDEQVPGISDDGQIPGLQPLTRSCAHLLLGACSPVLS